MKTIVRNFISVLRRFKMATVLNILGLSVAFAAFMVIMMQVDYDRNFDKCHKDYDKIFRLEFINPDAIQDNLNRPMSELFIKSSPHILAGALTDNVNDQILFSIKANGEEYSYKEDLHGVSPEYTDVFDFDFLEGGKDVLHTPGHVMIPLSLSRKFFGNGPATGKQLFGNGRGYTVGAVYRDLPGNSSIGNNIYTSLSEDNKQSWRNWNYTVFVRVDDAANAQSIIDGFKRNFDPTEVWGKEYVWGTNGIDLRLTKLADLHFITNVKSDITPKASVQTLLVFFAIGLVIILIAGINFTNFSTALTPMRVKSINTQKVLGGDERIIRLALILEAVATAFLSFLIALGLIVLFSRTQLASLVDADLSLIKQLPLIGVTAVIAVLTGLLAGLYPERYMTSFAPALVLKGNFGLSPKGRKLRNVLIGIQFTASFILIIGTLFMYLQNYYMQHAPLGFDKDEMVITDLDSTILKSKDAFTNQLKTFSGIEDVTYSEYLLSSSDRYMGWGREYNGESVSFKCLPVDYTFLKMVGINVVEGRDFRIEDSKTKHGAFIFNETARRAYKLELGSMIDSAVIIGFMPDVKFTSFRKEVAPMAFYLWGTDNWGTVPNYAYVKVKAGSDMRAAMSHVRATLSKFDAAYPFNVRFYDTVMQQLYEKEDKLSTLIALFSMIAIFISTVGVFGLVVFDSEYRRKEIGLRKVMGSTTKEILLLFNKTYIKMLCFCFVLAAPAAWYAVQAWLQNFAYRTPMYWWVYLAAFVLVGLITTVTVTFQNWHVANANPVDSIKTE